MKRKLVLGAVLAVLICIGFMLNAEIADPADFTGIWYRAGDSARFIFEDGIILNHEQESILLDDAVFSGAYAFGKGKASLFLVDDQGVGEVVELHLIHASDGDILCQNRDGRQIVWFRRSKDTGKAES